MSTSTLRKENNASKFPSLCALAAVVGKPQISVAAVPIRSNRLHCTTESSVSTSTQFLEANSQLVHQSSTTSGYRLALEFSSEDQILAMKPRLTQIECSFNNNHIVSQ
ncbi:Uncharacterized protein TPS_00031 [Trichinella pseudospiralis]